MAYTITQAKADWDSLLRKAEDGQPQIIKRRQQEVAVVVSVDDWTRFVGDREGKADTASKTVNDGATDF